MNWLSFPQFSINVGADWGWWNKLWIHFFFLVTVNFVSFGTVKGAAGSSGGRQHEMHGTWSPQLSAAKWTLAQIVLHHMFSSQGPHRSAWFFVIFLLLDLVEGEGESATSTGKYPASLAKYIKKNQEFILLFMLPCLSDPFLRRANRLSSAVRREHPVSLFLLLRATLLAQPFTAVKNESVGY